ncbi:MAG: alkyl sulfatase dimerization domain-containing protein [Blautia marasmi]
MIGLMGGAPAVLDAAESAVREKDYQWCLELCDLLLEDHASAGKEVLRLKAAALEGIAEYETSANGRHYYIACARELGKPPKVVLYRFCR